MNDLAYDLSTEYTPIFPENSNGLYSLKNGSKHQ